MGADSRKPIKLVCCDDSDRLTAAIERLLNMQPDIEVVGTLGSADALVDSVRELKPNVVLMDLTMAGREPLKAVADLVECCPESKVIVYSGHSDPRAADAAIEAGAWGYVHKHDAPDQLISAIRRVVKGEVVLPPGV